MDWLQTLKEQGEIAERLAINIPKAIGRDDLTLEQASQLYRMVEQGAQDFDKIVEIMDEHDLDETMYDVADSLENIWAKLSIATANKVRVMQGLSLIEMPED